MIEKNELACFDVTSARPSPASHAKNCYIPQGAGAAPQCEGVNELARLGPGTPLETTVG